MTDNQSAIGKLNATRKELMALRDAAEDIGLRERITILIQNIDGLKTWPDDPALLKQFDKNTRDLKRYKDANQL